MRVLFRKKEDQKKFIEEALTVFPVKDIAKMCSLSERTIRDWRRGKFLPKLDSLQEISKKTGVPIPSNITIKNDYWYAIENSSLGGKALIKKYGRIPGDINYRKMKWFEWWEKKGKYKKHSLITKPLPIKKPRKSKKLAEFVGVMLGDGNISSNQICITLHSTDDEEYGHFVNKLIKDLFDVYVGRCNKKNNLAFSLLVSRIELVRFCTKILGLKKGNKIKHQVDIPNWIKKRKSFSIACARGLFDTDGCVFTHRYKVKNKIYSYKKLSFTSYSRPLLQSFFEILKSNGLNPRFALRSDVRLDNIKDVQNYFKIFGSHNPKHLKRYKINV